MCRWIAYQGNPIFINELVVKPGHSLLAQSLNSRLLRHTDGSIWHTNGDGFGIGWYGDKKDDPGLFRDATPAWNDDNLHEVSAQIKSGLFMAHIRAATAGGVQRSNSHPFKYKNWLFQHNGGIENFRVIRQTLLSQIAPDLFPFVKGSTDSEICFYLALTLGLEDSSRISFEKMIAAVETACVDHNIKPVYNFSCALMNGETLYTFLTAKNNEAKTQFYSTSPDCIEDLTGTCSALSGESVVVVSEPLDELEHHWQEVKNNSFLTFQNGHVQKESFESF